MNRVLIIGGGAAGMFASIFAARGGREVHVFEKNDKPGRKLFITGKGRCNVTSSCDTEIFFERVVSNPRFLYSSFYGFNNRDVMEFFEQAGVALKEERGERVFPASDHSSDIIAALQREMKRAGVKLHCGKEALEILTEEASDGTKRCRGVRLKDGAIMEGCDVVVASGGISYPNTGSTGDGYRFAEELGIKVTALLPSLVPFTVQEPWVKELMGLSLRNVEARICDGKKELFRDFGEMLFTHYGVSGPLMLTASSLVGPRLVKKGSLTLTIDLKPALSREQLDKRLLRDFEENHNRQFKNSLGKLFPSKLIPVMVKLSGIDPDKKVHEITREERQHFLTLIKNLTLTIVGLRDYNEAIITKGGVSVKELNPATMESKHVEGLYFIGEVLDLDAVTGGYNLQIAWSTAYAAGDDLAGKGMEAL